MIFLYATASRPILEPTQPPIQWIQGALFASVKWPRREADHSPPSSSDVNNVWSCNSTPPYGFMARCLVKHRDLTLFELEVALTLWNQCFYTFLLLTKKISIKLKQVDHWGSDNLEIGVAVQKSVHLCFNSLDMRHSSRSIYLWHCVYPSDIDVERAFPNVKTNPTVNSILNLFEHKTKDSSYLFYVKTRSSSWAG
jgi:hypothetical protein